MRVEIYKNLHKKCWSIRHKGKVINHTQRVMVHDASFVVQPAGRKKVLENKRKNVHAFVRGTLMAAFDNIEINGTFLGLSKSFSVSYDPYRFGYFYKLSDLTPIHEANIVLLNEQGVNAWNLEDFNKLSTTTSTKKK